MFRLLKTLLTGSPDNSLCIQAYWCETSIKLPTKISTPLGGKITVITACVDIYYQVEAERIDVRRVKLSQEGGRIVGARQAINVAATHRGEAWYAYSVCSESELRKAVLQDLRAGDSRLCRIMMSKWRVENRDALICSAIDAINRKAAPEDIAKLIIAAGKGGRIAITYTKADGTATNRQVTVEGHSGSLLRGREHENGEIKSFRLDRISQARSL